MPLSVIYLFLHITKKIHLPCLSRFNEYLALTFITKENNISAEQK